MKTLEICLNPSYSICIGQDLLANGLFSDYCYSLKKRLAIIHDDNESVKQIAQNIQTMLLQANLSIELLCFPSGEKYKTRETKQKLEDQLLDKQYGRDSCLIAVGGGVVSDLAGFLASTYCREIPCIYIPTTLLAMVDASIGGKTGVNTPHGKNLIGTFHQPKAVFMDVHTLKTLPKKEWRNGFAEIIKHSLIADATLFSLLTSFSTTQDQKDLINIIHQSCLIKKSIVEQDEKELGLRQLLNYGHTIGHAIEKIENYNIAHGEAVAIGILVEAYLSVQCGFLSKNALTMIEKLLHDYQLPLKTHAFQNLNLFLNTLILDKKSKAKQAYFVLLDKIGQAHSESDQYSFCVEVNKLKNTLEWAKKYFG